MCTSECSCKNHAEPTEEQLQLISNLPNHFIPENTFKLIAPIGALTLQYLQDSEKNILESSEHDPLWFLSEAFCANVENIDDALNAALPSIAHLFKDEIGQGNAVVDAVAAISASNTPRDASIGRIDVKHLNETMPVVMANKEFVSMFKLIVSIGSGPSSAVRNRINYLITGGKVETDPESNKERFYVDDGQAVHRLLHLHAILTLMTFYTHNMCNLVSGIGVASITPDSDLGISVSELLGFNAALRAVSSVDRAVDDLMDSYVDREAQIIAESEDPRVTGEAIIDKIVSILPVDIMAQKLGSKIIYKSKELYDEIQMKAALTEALESGMLGDKIRGEEALTPEEGCTNVTPRRMQ